MCPLESFKGQKGLKNGELAHYDFLIFSCAWLVYPTEYAKP